MSIKIHHGPNGSFKTSGAIQDDAVPALKAGRLIVTNVRGFTLERVLEAMPELPESVDIINLDLESLADLERMRTWFQWVPRGAFIIFDETQLVFPKAWREKDLDRFEFPGGPEAAALADRPMSWLDGWTRHRHWNWDIVLTTPNINYIRDDIRMTCEMAYRHSNLAVIGIKGRYKEAQHDAQIARPPLEGTIVEYKKINPDTFKLYQSTATGIAQDTTAGKNLFRSPKLLFLLALLSVLVISLLFVGPVSFVDPNLDKAPVLVNPSDVSKAAPVAAKVHSSSNSAVSVSNVAGSQGALPDAALNHPLAPRTFVLRAVMSGSFDGQQKSLGIIDVVDPDGAVFKQDFTDLEALGYHVQVKNNCLVNITHPLGFKGQAFCAGRPMQHDSKGNRLEISGLEVASSLKDAVSAASGAAMPTNMKSPVSQ